MLRKGWVTRVYVARFVFWLEVEVVEEGDWLFGGQGEGRAFKSRGSASEVILFTDVTDIFQASLLHTIGSIHCSTKRDTVYAERA
jgi:hypothetical protein